MPDRHPSIVNVEDVPWDEFPPHEDRFAARYKRIGKAAGGDKLGLSHYEVPPGRTAFPTHYHFATEEAIYILGGSGKMRIGDQSFQVGKGDYIAMPVGPDHAHQLTNTGKTKLRYLCMSASSDPDIVVYPDSNKVGAFANWNDPETRFRGMWKLDKQSHYYEDE
jgi:uncharacterized cupin superfamily protein